jgi:hypothetical protein
MCHREASASLSRDRALPLFQVCQRAMVVEIDGLTAANARRSLKLK